MPVYVDGKEYLSSVEAAKMFGYVPDYITMLARQGLIAAKRYGRVWYVNPDSVRAFKEEQQHVKEVRAQELSQMRRAEYERHNGTLARTGENQPALDAHPAASIATEYEPAAARTTFAVRTPRQRSVKSAQFAVVSALMVALFFSGAYAYQKVSLADATRVIADLGERMRETTEQAAAQQAAALDALLVGGRVSAFSFDVAAYARPGEALLAFVEGVFSLHEAFVAHSGTMLVDLAPQTITVLERSTRALRAFTDGTLEMHALSVKGLGMLFSDLYALVESGQDAFAALEDDGAARRAALAAAASADSGGNWLDKVGAFFGKILFAIFGGKEDVITQAPTLTPRERAEPLNPLTVPTSEPDASPTPTQPARVVERTVPQTVIENITRTITLSGVSEETLAAALNQLENKLRQDITRITGVASGPSTYVISPPASGGTQNQIVLSQKIDQLSGVDISGGTITGAAISGGSVTASSLTGTVGISFGGTGTTTTPSQDQLLIGNATGYDLKTLTAGSGISISTSSNAVTITSTAGSTGQTWETFATGYLAPTTTAGVAIGATTTASATNALLQVNATSTTGTLIHASTTPSFAGNIMRFVSSAGTQLFNVAANGALTLAQALGVTSGGTGWGELQANTILLGNGTGALATTTAGSNGQALALVNGVPTWVSTTTLSTISGTLALNKGGTATTTFYNGGVVFYNSSLGTLSQASAQPGFFYDNTNSKLGIGTSSPWAKLSIEAIAGVNAFAIGSSTDTHFVVDLAGLVGIGTTSPSKKLSVKNTVATAQFSLAYDDTRYVNFQVDSVGDLIIDPQGDDARLNDDNLWVCAGGACPTGAPSGTGNIIVETALGVGSSTPWANLSVAADAGEIPFSVGSTTSLLHIAASGSVGLGTAAPGEKFELSASDSSVYASSGSTAVPWTEGSASVLRISNQSATNDSAAYLNLYARNASSLANHAYIGVVSNSGVYVPDIVIGQRTGSASYAERMRIDSSGNVGIGTTSPAWKLQVNGTRPSFALSDSGAGTNLKHWLASSQGGNLYIATSSDSLATSTISFLTLDGTNYRLGIATSSPSQQLSVTGKLFVGNNQPASAGLATSTFQGDLRITGKLDVPTIDPVYQIAGVKYATYGHSTIGIKEETTQTIELSEYDVKSGRYVYEIAFSELPKGSDFWLFYQVTDFGADWKNLVVSLTPGFDGSAFYEKDVTGKRLLIKSTQPGEVSLRLVANRHDSEKWPNLRLDQDDPFTHFTLPEKW
jgi:hypothetical protein